MNSISRDIFDVIFNIHSKYFVKMAQTFGLIIHKDLHSKNQVLRISAHHGAANLAKKPFKKFRESWMAVAYGNLNQKITCAA